MRCGVERQLPVGHVVYHGDAHAMYLRECHQRQQQQQHVTAETARRQALTAAVKNENDNENERNSTASASLFSRSNDIKTQKYDISSWCSIDR